MQIDPAFGLLTTDKAIARAAKQVVASALEATSSIDPIIGAEFSRAFSFFNLVVQRHGLLIQRVLGDTLAASGRFEVLTESPIPITAAALDLLLSENSEKDLASIRLKSDSRVERSVMMDIVVIDDPRLRGDVSVFVRLLWERGTLFERETIAAMKHPPLDLSNSIEDDRERLTLEAMKKGEPLIYGGRISSGDLLGKPDLLRKEIGGYIPGDIKSGRGKEGGDDNRDGRPKRHYAVQLGLYIDILERLNLSAGRRAFVLDVRGEEVIYDFSYLQDQDLWNEYESVLTEARSVLSRQVTPRPGYTSTCKLCHWHNTCVERLESTDDLTLIPSLRRSDRNTMNDRIPTISALATVNPEQFIKGEKTEFPGIGANRFHTLHTRAAMLKAAAPKAYLRAPVRLGSFPRELFFDIEVDPLRDVCYLHGFVERKNRDNGTERFVSFFAENATPKAEHDAFAAAFDYFVSRTDAGIYYYSKYERTLYRKLQRKYPDICEAEDIEELFAPGRAIDLYGDVVLKATEWPTRDYSIKTLAKYLGFAWRDTHPSGAASIEWFDRWCRERNPSVRQRMRWPECSISSTSP